MSDKEFTTWVVYAHPADYPTKYVARAWYSTRQGMVKMGSAGVILTDTLEQMHEEMEWKGLVMLLPMPGDDPVIIETWI